MANNLYDVLDIIYGLFSRLVPLILTAALVAFLWGGAQFIFHAGEPGKRDDGKKIMLYGVITLFVMLSVWGIVGIIANTFGVSAGGGSVFVPYLPQR